MLSKNNIKEYIEKNQPNKQRFTIKKLTVGVASVLIGITFAGTTAASADEVPANSGSADNNTSNQSGNASLTSASQVALQTANGNSAANSATSGLSTDSQSANSSATAASSANTNAVQTNTLTVNNAKAMPAQNYAASLARDAGASVEWPNKGVNNNLNGDQLEQVKNASLNESQQKINNRYNEEQNTEQAAANKTKPVASAAVHNNQNVSSWSDLQAKLADSSVDQITITGNITADTPLHIGGGNATFSQNSRDWAGLANAENRAQPTASNGHTVTIVGANGAGITVARNMQALKLAGSGWNITFKNLTFNTDNQVGVLDLTKTQGKQSVTFDNVRANGSALYNGGGDTDVYITGNTTSNVDTQTLTTAAQQGFGDQYSSQFGTYIDGGVTTNGQNGLISGDYLRAAANVRAANIIVTDGATFNVNRTVDGDGLVGYDGLIRSRANDQGTKTGRGNIYVGKGANLNINLKDSQLSGEALKASERSNRETHNIGIRVNNDGTFLTGEGAHVTMKVGHGRAISFGSYNLNPVPGSNANYIQRADNYQMTENNPNIENNVYVGKDSTVNIMGREGLILGNRGTFISDAGSVTNIDNWGNGNGFDGGDFGMFIAGPKSTVKFTSNGRSSAEGNWAHNNYFALGEDGKIIVDKDASLAVILTGQGLSLYDDNIQLLSEHYHDPLVWVKDGASLDIRSDAQSRDAELISVPLGGGTGSRTAYFVMDNAKYINLERDAETKQGYLIGTNKNGDGNLIFMDSTSGTFFSGPRGGVSGFVGQGNYELFKWNNKNLTSKGVQYNSTLTPKENTENFYNSAQQVWDGVKGFYQARNGYNTDAAHMKLIADDDSDVTKPAEKGGAAFNDVQNGFSLTNSQRLVIMSHNIEPVTPDHTTDYYTKTDVDKHIIREVHYVLDNGETNDADMAELSDDSFTTAPTGDQVRQTNHFTGTGYIDITTGDLVEIQKNADGTPKLDKYGHLQAVLDKDGKPVPGALNWTIQADGKPGRFDATTIPSLKDSAKYQFERIDVSEDTGLATDANGNPIYVQKQQYGKDGQPVYKNGQPVYMYAQKVDAQGNPVFDENGNPVYDYNKPLYVQAKDENGQLLWNEDGTPKYEQKRTAEIKSTNLTDKTGIPAKSGVTQNTATPEIYYVIYKAVNPAETRQATLGFQDDTTGNPINNNTISGVDLTPATGAEGTAISFGNGDQSVQRILNNGYVIDSITGTGINGAQKVGSYADAAKLFGNFGKDTAHFIIHFKHGAQLVDGNHPLAGNDPANKQHFANLTRDDLTHQVTETVHYVHDNADGSTSDIAREQNQTLTFHGYTYLDKVTGQLVDQGSVADKDGNAINNGNRNNAYEVNADPANGKVTWEADGNKTAFDGYDAVNVDGYKYNHTTTNPAGYANKVDATGKIDTITPIADIQQINKDSLAAIALTLHYTQEEKDQLAGLKFVDQDAAGFDNANLYSNPAIVATGLKTTYEVTGKPGTAINFDDGANTIQGTLKALQDRGYELVTNQFANGGSFDNDSNTDQHFVIVMKHKHQDVTPDQDTENLVKDVTRTIDYKDTDGKAVNGSPDKTDSYQQHVYFVRTAVRDLVTNQILGYDLNGDAKVDISLALGNQAWQPATKGADGKYTVNTAADQFADVKSQDPEGLGYNSVNYPTVNGHAVNYNSPAEVVHVIYSKNPQPVKEQGSVKVNYFDDTTQQTLTKVGNTTLGYDSGKVDSGTSVNFSAHDTQIQALKNAGYRIVTDPTAEMPKTVGNNDLTYTIHVAHVITPVTPDNPGHGLGHDDLTKTVTETVHYTGAGNQTPADKTAKLTFNGIAYYDEVTKKWTDANGAELADQTKNVTWNAQDGNSFSVVVTPAIDGYTAKVEDADYDDGNGNVREITGINHNSADIKVTVDYSRQTTPVVNDQVAIVDYIDADENNAVIRTSGNLTGKPGAKINYSTAQTIQELENKGYVLVNDGFPAGATFDNDDSTTQTYKVILQHGHTTVTPGKPGHPGQPIDPKNPDGPKYPDGTDINNLKKTGTQTIHYVGAGDKTPADNEQSFDFTKTITFDNVTEKIINDSGWNVNSHTFGSVDTPVVDGFHADQRTAGNTTVTPNDLNKTVTVTYTPNGKIIPVDPSGKPIPNAPTPQYPTNPKDPTTVTPDEPVPSIPGMTPDQPTVTPTDPSKDTEVVYRTPTGDEKATLHIIDITDGNKELDSFAANGKDNAAISFNGAASTIDALVKAGYKVNSIVQATTDPNNPTEYGTDYNAAAGQWKFDDQPGVDQAFYVFLEHDTTPINPENAFGRNDLTRTVTETVHYVDEATGRPVATDYTNTLRFTGQGMVDKVTNKMLAVKSVENGQITYDHDVNKEIDISTAKDSDFVWSNPVTLQKVVSPTIAGYTIDAAKTTPSDLADGNDIKAIENVAYNHGNVEATVYYKGNPVKTQQTASLVVKDVTTGQEMTLGQYTASGLEGDPISFNGAGSQVAGLLSNGYKWVKATYNGQDLANVQNYQGINFGNYDSADDQAGASQQWVIELEHGYTPVNPDHPDDKDGYTKDYLDRIITRTVSYVDQQGNEMPGLNKETQTAHFRGEGYLDNVTGKWVKVENGQITGLADGLTWTPSEAQSFNAIAAKKANGYHVVSVDGTNVAGYTVDRFGAVSAQNVTRNTPSSQVVVTYAPDSQVPADAQGSIKYIDDTTGNTMADATFDGHVGDPINYTTADKIKDYESKGYELVSNNFNDGHETFTKGDNSFEVHFKHGTRPVDPDHPADPNKPVDPTKPNTPTPTNPNLGKTDLDKTITRTVEYHYADGSEAHAPVTQNVEFKGHGTIDLVTGNLVTMDGDKIVNQQGKITWDHDNQSFANVPAINMSGYHITDITKHNTNANVDPTTGAVAGETVTPTSQNSTIIISLAPNQTPAKEQGSVKVNYFDDTTQQALTKVGNTTLGYNTGKVVSGTNVNFSAHDAQIQALKDAGYRIVTDPTAEMPKTVGNSDLTYTIHVAHTTTTVTPDKPGQPGQPVDPNNPNGPKYPDGTDINNLKKTGTQTIHYVGAGDKTPADNQQSFDFTKTITFDNVTGKITNDSGWNVDSHTFGSVDTPIIDGFHADQRTAGNTTVTPDDLNKTVTVTYTPNGKIIPVDPNGKPIPNTPTPQYPTNPKDPTTVTPDEPVPTIPGYQPSVPTVTPTDPGKDTPVIYTPDEGTVQGQVTYHDDTTNTDLLTDKFSGKVGTKIGYTTADKIKAYEDQGYELVSNDFKDGNETFAESGNTFVVHLKHGTLPVTPDQPGKPGQPINPNNPDGPKYPEGTDSLTKTVTRTIHYDGAGTATPQDVKQTVTFTAKGVLDKVTGKWVTPLTWSGSQTVGAENTPVVNGYHVTHVSRDSNDGVNVDAKTLTHDDSDYTVTVTYAGNGHIIPVDPNGNPIPNVDHPQYPTDPTNPTKVTPNEPVPTIPGMTPEHPTVTPTDPGKDTPVIYTPDVETVQGQVTYHDDTTNTDLLTDKFSGKVGAKIDYTTADKIKAYEDQGYELVSNNFKDGNETFAKDGNTFVVHLKHGTLPVTPDQPGKPGQPINPNNPDGPKYPEGTDSLTKTVTRTIHYDGAGNASPQDVKQTVTFTAKGVLDKVTGKWVTPLTWSGSQTVDGENTPVVNGYHVTSVSRDSNDGVNVAAKTLTHDDSDYTVTVTYAGNGHIIPVDPNGNPIPGADHPQFPTNPENPGKTTDGKIPDVPGYTPENGQPGDPVAPNEDPGKDVEVPYKTPTTDQQAVVNYVDVDDGHQLATSGILTGKPGTSINQLYSTAAELQKLKDEGYELVYNGFDGDGIVKNFDNDNGVTQVFTVALKKVQPTPQQPHQPTPQQPTPQQPSQQPQQPTPQQPAPQQPQSQQPMSQSVAAEPVPQAMVSQAMNPQPVQETNGNGQNAALPQTGNTTNETTSAVALGVATAFGALGLAGIDKKKRRN